MTRVDLDLAEARFAKAAGHRWPYSQEHTQALAELALDVPALVAELRAARDARAALIEFHDSYDSGGDDRYKVRGRIFRIVDDWDRAVGS